MIVSRILLNLIGRSSHLTCCGKVSILIKLQFHDYLLFHAKICFIYLIRIAKMYMVYGLWWVSFIKVFKLLNKEKSGTQPVNFQGSDLSWNYGTTMKLSLKTKKRPRRVKDFEFLLLDTPKNYILSGKSNPKKSTVRVFFSKNQGAFFEFQKMSREASLSPL